MSRPVRTASGTPAPRARGAGARDGAAAKRPKRTQRERLVQAMIDLAAKAGYQNVSVAQVSSHAGVSSATFYEQFNGKEECLLEAYRTVSARVLEQMQPVPETVASDEEWAREARTALGMLLRAVQRDPEGARVLYFEPLAAGSRVLEERGRVLAEFEGRAQDFLASTPAGGVTLDLPAPALVGAVRSIVSRHLRTNAQDELPALAEQLVAWVRSYAIAPGRERWSTGPHALLAASRTPKPAARRGARAPGRLPRGRHGLPAGVVARSQRTRIVYATAQVMMAKGYASATVADIVAAAGVARDVFYEHFADKQNAFLEAQQHPTQHILDTCAAAYFAAQEWPERVWSGLGALIELIVENPELSHLRLVECYAAGPAAIRRAEDITRSFTIFLEEGYRLHPQAQELPRVCSQAIGGAVFEVVQRHVARRDYDGLRRHLPQLVYVAIAPFTGPEEAARAIERIAAHRPAERSR